MRIIFCFYQESNHDYLLVKPGHYRYAPHNDVSVNDVRHIRWLSHKIIIREYHSGKLQVRELEGDQRRDGLQALKKICK